ncbi:MAG TPA: hypothetical protein ENG35_06595 [Desulfobacteraceae bacterium]|nr:hypothetical protein [Desulfobacteraceae bacterium]
MDSLEKIKKILVEILDIEDQEIHPETYLVRELGAESIDLLELAVELNTIFNIDVNDDEIFLKNLRADITDGKEKRTNLLKYLAAKFPFLGKTRLEEILADLEEGPVLKVKDIASYVEWKHDR